MQASFPVIFRFFAAILTLLLAASVPPLSAQTAGNPAQRNYITADLVAENAPVAGETLTLALRFQPQEGWHGYWSNPGDAGEGMRLDWHLPEGWQAGEPQYPVPHQLVLFGLINHVYEQDYAVLVPVTIAPDAQVTNLAPITLDAQWLACSDQLCVPQGATLTLRFPQAGAGLQDQFDAHRAAIPPLIKAASRFALTADHLRIAIPLPENLALSDTHVFLEQVDVIDYAGAQSFARNGDMLVATIPRDGLRQEPGRVSGILTFDNAGAGIRFEAELGDVPMGGKPVGTSAASTSFALLLGGALLGGLLLNLMPCVFPILSLKALALVRAGSSEREARVEGISYTAGVILACLALGGLLLALRAGGEQIGWAFQLQEPGVVVVLLVLAAALTANFAGVFELPGLPIRSKGQPLSAFGTGLLAAFVATPCTGPFMAAAMGAALLLPWAQALLLFAALGLGLALPFLLLGLVPALREHLPKPGPWMERFRRLMAIPMGLTAMALIWLTSRIGGQGFAMVALVLVLGVMIALMVVGRLQRSGKMAWPAFALIAAPFAIFAAFALPASYSVRADDGGDSLLDPAPYSAETLAQARASGQPVFLWFTADWCLTCKVNEQVAIERQATRQAFQQAGVVAMRGDWTRADPAITRFLEERGVAGVPLYLWYPVGSGEPEQLPQVLTPDSLIQRAQQN